MNLLTQSLPLLIVSLFCLSQSMEQRHAAAVQSQGGALSDVPQRIDTKARYLFYLHGKIVEQGRRPTHLQHGVYEYDQILDAFKQNGFVVVSEQRKKDTDVERYGKKVAGQIKRLLDAGVPPEQITVVGASQGSWMAMLASTYLENRKVNFVVMAACSADEGFLDLVNLHGNVLSIYERSDLAGSCQKYRTDATGLGEYKEVELNTGLKHGFIYKPMKEWVEPAVAWAHRGGPGEGEQAVREMERMYRDAIMRQDVAAVGRILADDFIATSSRGEIRDKAKEIDDIRPSPDFRMEAFNLDDINVRLFGDTAIVTGRSTLQVAFRGRSNTSIFRYTRVYVRRNGLWQAVAQQLTRMPQQ
jgi:ketosteroid isomerase-like protein